MLKNLAGLLRQAARALEESPRPAAPDAAPEKPDEEPTPPEERPPPGDQIAITPPHAIEPPTPRLWQRSIRAERAHLRWLRGHLYIVGIAVGLAVALVVAEKWLILGWDWLVSRVPLTWTNLTTHPVALIGVGIILFYLLFGLQWLRLLDDLVHWILGGIKRRPQLSALVGSILLLIGLWLFNNRGTWVVLPFTVGQQAKKTSLNGETVAVQLIAELNQVGVGNPPPVLILREPQEPRTSSGNVTSRRDLPLDDECDAVLRGPGDFRRLGRISFPRVLAGSQSNRLDLGNLSIGTFNIPSRLFTQSILKILPTGYREFNGQINENKGELEISVSSSNPHNSWRVAGPSDIFPEMVEYLALRMALDLDPELIKSSGLDKSPSDRDLAFAMGNQAFLDERYQRARAFFELADRFSPLDEKVLAMLGLTYYHLAPEQSNGDRSRSPEGNLQLDTALQAMEAAVGEDPSGDSSLLLSPYLACLYHKAGMKTEAEKERDRFTTYLRRLESQDIEVRVNALKQLPVRGPGRLLSVTDGDVFFVDGSGAIKWATGQLSDQQASVSLLLADQNPRQIGAYGDSNLVFISPDGAVRTYDYAPPSGEPGQRTLVVGRALNGVQQIRTSGSRFGRTNLFLLNRDGQVYWCDPEAEVGSASACPPRQERPLVADPSSPTNVRQIFSVEDRLYMLDADGAVWYTEVNVIGRASFTPRQLAPPPPQTQVQEILATGDGILYLLHDNGNVWRYYDDGRAGTDDLKLIDPATDTAQIFPAGDYLYLLKSQGAVSRINNPRNPTPSVDFNTLWTPPEGTSIQEIFVTQEHSVEGNAPSGRTIYLLTDQRVPMKSTDTGDLRATFTPIYVPAPTQTEVSP